jgi:molybdopterin molybdotransferase
MRTPVAQHLDRVAALLAPLRERPDEIVALREALGRVTAHAVLSPLALPPFRNSQMDGFAVRAAEVAGAPVDLPVDREIAAAPGAPGALEPGTAIRIMTGAPVPEGADAVVPVEDTETLADGRVRIRRARAAGEYVREAGSDLEAGAQLLPAGVRLASRHLAAVAAAGIDAVAVRRRVRVAVVSTGSELVDPGEPLGPGRIPDANGIALDAAARAVGAEVVARARVADDPAELERVLRDAVAAGAELVLTSGGISMGEHEVVRELLEPRGAHVDVLALQPGGPQATALFDGVPVVCFPGNPVSSQLSFELFVAPTLRVLAGLPAREVRRAVLDVGLTSPAGRRQLLRGRRTGPGRVTTASGPGSHLVAALAASELILDIPEDVVELAPGDSVETWEL